MGSMPDDAEAAAEPRTPLFRHIDHVGIAVHDLDSAAEWYAEKFGMRVVHVEVNEEQGVREAMLEVGDGGPLLQLIAPLDGESPVARFLASRGEGLHQVAYAVDDVEETASALRERGIETLYETARPGTGGSLVNFVHPKAAGGFLLELVQTSAAPSTAPDARDSAG